MWNMLTSGTHRLSTGATAHTAISAIIKALQPVRVSNGPLEGSSTVGMKSFQKRGEQVEVRSRSEMGLKYVAYRRPQIGLRNSFESGFIHASALRPFIAKMPWGLFWMKMMMNTSTAILARTAPIQPSRNLFKIPNPMAA